MFQAHFTRADYLRSTLTNKLRLKKTAVPSIFVHTKLPIGRPEKRIRQPNKWMINKINAEAVKLDHNYSFPLPIIKLPPLDDKGNPLPKDPKSVLVENGIPCELDPVPEPPRTPSVS